MVVKEGRSGGGRGQESEEGRAKGEPAAAAAQQLGALATEREKGKGAPGCAHLYRVLPTSSCTPARPSTPAPRDLYERFQFGRRLRVPSGLAGILLKCDLG